MKKVSIIAIVIVVIIGTLLVVRFVGPHKSTTPTPDNTAVTTTPVTLPEPTITPTTFPALKTQYITAQGWPPVLRTLKDPFTCTGTNSIERTINGKRYCVTTETEGAAGSSYTTYTYRSDQLQTTFTLRFVQCDNYNNSQKTACGTEQKNFNPDIIVEPALDVACYTYHQVATKDAPYAVDETIKITTYGDKVTGTKQGTQVGPDMSNGYQGTLIGTIYQNVLTAVFDYTVEGSHNKEQEEYGISDFKLTKHRYPLIDKGGMLVPDKTGPEKDIVYNQASCN